MDKELKTKKASIAKTDINKKTKNKATTAKSTTKSKVKENTRPLHSSKKVTKEKVEKSPTKKKRKKSKKNKLMFKFIFSFALICTIVLGGLVFYIVWDSNKVFKISFYNTEGVGFEGFDSVEVKNRKSFSFKVVVEEGLTAYSNIYSVTANGKRVKEKDDLFIVENITQDTNIVVTGYGTPGLELNGSVLTNSSNVEKIIIPLGVTEIGKHVFYQKNNLVEVNFPNSLVKIGEMAFANCFNLEKMNQCESLVDAGYYAFVGTKWFTNQPNGLVMVGKSAYTYKGNASESYILNIPEGTKGITAGAFAGQIYLSKVTLPSSLLFIGDFAFFQCYFLNYIEIRGNLEFIGLEAFDKTAWYESQANGIIYLNNWVYKYKGEHITDSLTIKQNTRGIATAAFRNYQTLKTINLPKSMQFICKDAFVDCIALKSVTLPENLVAIGEGAFANSGLTQITLPGKLNKIDVRAFSNCLSLEEVTITSNLPLLSDAAFAGCKALKSLLIEGEIEAIHALAFSACNSLASITVSSKHIPKIQGAGFLINSPLTLKIFVDSDLLVAFKSAQGWSYFENKIFTIEV